ncbi:MAG TPA: orotidine-5'-phosphate decarboxylase [Thermoanaerobaculia bacterium]|nr:orotidine-5'-phosphate decarboxylase [Thermoanaerobaculia bacterium]
MEPADRLIVAIDRSERDGILRLVDELHDVAGIFKIGLQAFTSNGPSIVRDVIGRGAKVFLDLKYHDIPNTASSAVAEAVSLGASMITIHASGGRKMMEACAGSVNHSNALLLGVTVLTSLDDQALKKMGWETSVTDVVALLAAGAWASGIKGVVASPHEIETIRRRCGEEIRIVTPGIRGRDDEMGDQSRTMTATQAIEAGADYIVVGRPITAATASSPRDAAAKLLDEIFDGVARRNSNA